MKDPWKDVPKTVEIENGVGIVLRPINDVCYEVLVGSKIEYFYYVSGQLYRSSEYKYGKSAEPYYFWAWYTEEGQEYLKEEYEYVLDHEEYINTPKDLQDCIWNYTKDLLDSCFCIVKHKNRNNRFLRNKRPRKT